MNIWAIADLHLNISVPEKTMEYFSIVWKDYVAKIKRNWEELVAPEDLVLIPGDICWAISLEEAVQDLNWIDRLPGKKLLLKGNHDYWWKSLAKLKQALPPSINVLQNDAYTIEDVSIGGTRLWDTKEYSFQHLIEFTENPRAAHKNEEAIQEDLSEKIYERELKRLEISLSKLDPNATRRIAMTHYPPIGNDLNSTKCSEILEKYKIDVCVFGHLHSLKKIDKLFGKKNKIDYIFVAADYIDFTPVKIFNAKQA